MAGRSKNGNSEELFMRAAYDVHRDIELTYQCDVVVTLRPTDRKGVYYVQASCTPSGGPLLGQKVEVYCKEWPHATKQSLPAHIFNALMKLAHQCEGHAACELPRR